MRMEKLIKIIINEIAIEPINRMTKSLKQILNSTIKLDKWCIVSSNIEC